MGESKEVGGLKIYEAQVYVVNTTEHGDLIPVDGMRTGYPSEWPRVVRLEDYQRVLGELGKLTLAKPPLAKEGNTPHQQRTRDKGAAPHWLRCDHTEKGYRCMLGSGHPGAHEFSRG